MDDCCIVIGGPCRQCGYPHSGATCEQHHEQMRRVTRRIARMLVATASGEPGVGFAWFRKMCLRRHPPTVGEKP